MINPDLLTISIEVLEDMNCLLYTSDAADE